jgi:hypothetical protein
MNSCGTFGWILPMRAMARFAQLVQIGGCPDEITAIHPQGVVASAGARCSARVMRSLGECWSLRAWRKTRMELRDEVKAPSTLALCRAVQVRRGSSNARVCGVRRQT